MHSKNSLLLARSMIATDMHRTIKHSEAQYESTLCVQLANANKVPCVVYTVIDRVSALLIRWSRVRVSPDPPRICSRNNDLLTASHFFCLFFVQNSIAHQSHGSIICCLSKSSINCGYQLKALIDASYSRLHGHPKTP